MSTSLGTSASCAAPTANVRDEHEARDDQQVAAGHAQAGIARDGRRHAAAPSLAASSVRSASEPAVRPLRSTSSADMPAASRSRHVRGRIVADVHALRRPRRRGARARPRTASGSGFAAPTAAAVTTASKAPARPTRASTSCSEMSQFATTASLQAGGGEPLERGLRIRDRRRRRSHRSATAAPRRPERSSASASASSDAHSSRRAASDGGVVRADAVRAVVAHLDPHRCLAAREIDRRARGGARASAAGAAPAARWRRASPSRRR